MTVETQAHLDTLQNSVDGGIQATETYLENLKKQLLAYDTEYKVSETASSYLQTAIESANTAVEELKKSAETLRTTTLSAAQKPVSLVQTALVQVTDSLALIKDQAAVYDAKFKVVVGEAKTNVENLTLATRQRTTEAIHTASEHAHELQTQLHAKAASVGQSAIGIAGGVVQTVEAYDQYYKVSEMLHEKVQQATEKAKELDDQYQVSQKAFDVDAKVTGGLGALAIQKGSDMVQSSVAFLQEKIQYAKDVHNSENASPAVEPTAE
ncbi:hypothetical protein THRCLA_22392 [Thraustotheca clavata]|uniref:Uncharacterized protein n=1 Tax=Thraustotheca clavata TaxID=74557 RepID=A0A1V9Z2W1_9STRA|nr:hypothetical protein THRCLA_22392 [Thraustotheca clavata]